MKRKVYEVRAVRSGRWWALEVPAVPGTFSQARRLEQAEPMIREALSMMLDAPEDSFDVTVVPQIDGELDAAVRAARERREVAQHAQDDASAAIRDAVRLSARKGLTTRDAAELLGVSFQRVAKLAAEAS